MTALFEDKVVMAVAAELGKWKSDEQLTAIYNWPIDEQIKKLPEGFEELGEFVTSKTSTLDKTLCLREKIKELRFSLPLSKWVIECWGGITTGKGEDSLKACLAEADKNNFDFNRIASWSKHLAFKYPAQYAIYDARVIYSLNWLLFKAGSKQYFPAPSGRNSVMELLDYRILLFIGHYKVTGVEQRLKDDIEDRKKPGKKSSLAMKLKEELFIKSKMAFSEYCDLLKIIARELYPNDQSGLALTKVEIMLFSLADKNIALEVLGDFSKILTPSECQS